MVVECASRAMPPPVVSLSEFGKQRYREWTVPLAVWLVCVAVPKLGKSIQVECMECGHEPLTDTHASPYRSLYFCSLRQPFMPGGVNAMY